MDQQPAVALGAEQSFEKLSGKKLRCYAGFQFLTGPGSREIGLF